MGRGDRLARPPSSRRAVRTMMLRGNDARPLILRRRSSGRNGFLQINEAELRIFLRTCAQQDGEAKATEGTATLHPVGGVEYANLCVHRPGFELR